jgi:hypothetical protein
MLEVRELFLLYPTSTYELRNLKIKSSSVHLKLCHADIIVQYYGAETPHAG